MNEVMKLKAYFEKAKTREEDKMSDDALFYEAKENVEFFDKMLSCLQDMEYALNCEEVFSA